MLTHLLGCLFRCPGPRQGRSVPAAGEEQSGPKSEMHAERPDADTADRRSQDEIASIRGVGPQTACHLFEAGFTGVDDVRAASEAELASVPGVRSDIARKIKQSLG